MEPKLNKFSAAFREMAERIDRGLETEFAGAMLYVPPEGDPIAVVLTDPTRDKEAFLSLCMGKLKTVVDNMQAQAAGQYPGGFPRR